MLQQVDSQLASADTRGTGMLRQAKNVIHSAECVEQRTPPALVVNLLQVVQNLLQFQSLVVCLLLLPNDLLLFSHRFLLGGGGLRTSTRRCRAVTRRGVTRCRVTGSGLGWHWCTGGRGAGSRSPRNRTYAICTRLGEPPLTRRGPYELRLKDLPFVRGAIDFQRPKGSKSALRPAYPRKGRTYMESEYAKPETVTQEVRYGKAIRGVSTYDFLRASHLRQ